MSVAFIVWKWEEFLRGLFLRFSQNLAFEKYAVLTTFRKSYIKRRDFNIFKVSLLFLVKERPLYQNLKENWKYL